MKKRLKRVVCICTALSVGFVACLRAESVQLPIKTLSRTSEMVNYNLTIPEGVAPPVIWRSSNLKNWYFLSHTEVGQNTFSLMISGQAGFVQGFPRGYNPNDPECPIKFYQDQTLGSSGFEVVELQDFLIQKGLLVLPAGVSKGYFEGLTQSALASYQAMVGISPAVGYFGPITRSYFNSIFCSHNNVILNIVESPDNPDATFFRVEEDDESDEYTILTGMIKSGFRNSISYLKEFPFSIVTTGGSFYDLTDDVELEFRRDGVVIETVHDYSLFETDSGDQILVFDCEADVAVYSDDEIEFSLIVEFNPTLDGANYDTGSTISAEVMTSQLKPDSPFNVIASISEDVIANGYVQGKTHTLLTEGVTVDYFDESIFVHEDSEGEYAEFEIEFDLVAFEEDFYLSLVADVSVSFSVLDGAGKVVYSNGGQGNQSQVIASIIDSDSERVGDYYRIDEGDDADFIISVVYHPEVSGLYRVRIDSINVSTHPGFPDEEVFFGAQVFQTRAARILK